MTYLEAVNYIKKNGITKFEITSKLKTLKAGTILYFGLTPITDLINTEKSLSTMNTIIGNLNDHIPHHGWSESWRPDKGYSGEFSLT